jgi:hypothetical protein
MSNINQFKDKYVEFLNQLKMLLPTRKQKFEELINKCEKGDALIGKIAGKYYSKISSNITMKRQLLERRDKLFTVEKKLIIPDANMRKILKHCDEKNKDIVWEYLQLFYVILNNQSDSSNNTKECIEYSNKLIKSIHENRNKDYDKIKQDNEADKIIKDITNTFTKTMEKSGNGAGPSGTNFMKDMFDTSKLIADKYKDKLESGEVTLNDMMGSLKNMVGDNPEMSQMMDGLVGNDGNLNMENLLNNAKNIPGVGNMMEGLLKNMSGDGDGEGLNLGNILGNLAGGDGDSPLAGMTNMAGMAGLLGGDNPLGNMAGMADLLGGGSMDGLFDTLLGGNKKEPTEELTEEQVKQMEEFYSKMSTEELAKLMKK